ncbi:MAG TPA: circadian clock protein KaiC [Vicinamibacterales bacterium]|nr:circadian clock protein KaiC [Vicinamibacterales bacterium]
MNATESDRRGLPKCPTGIEGLDEITGGGLPRGRPTLVCGAAGCGKTLLAVEFLVRGAIQHGEPGVFLAFEETAQELADNVRSLGFDLDDLMSRNQIAVDHVRVERSEIEETGEYDLEGLFIRLGYAIDRVGARRVVLDTVETLFAGLSNDGILRAELRRLFRWLKDKGVTAIITGERGDRSLTRHGLEEYVSDCVILLDHRVTEQLSTRRLRIVKYRGTSHGTNEYPFLIDHRGVQVIPITSLGLQRRVSDDRVPTGTAGLDEMLGGQGFYRGSSVLVSGTAGTGKTSLAAHFADAACRRGERCLYIAFEESAPQILRNVASIGIHLAPWIESGLLQIRASRPTAFGLEAHLVEAHSAVRQFQPQVVVVDPVSNLTASGSTNDVQAMLARFMDSLKSELITSFFTYLSGADDREATDIGISSMIDTWLLLRDVETSGERNRVSYVLKSRGMAHSNQLREFHFTPDGVRLLPAYIGPEGVLTGSARVSQAARERSARAMRSEEIGRLERELARKRERLEARIQDLRRAFASEEEDLKDQVRQRQAGEIQERSDEEQMAASRHVVRSPRSELT